MNKFITAGLIIAFAAASFAKEEEQMMFAKPGSAKGYIAVVNKQTKIAEKEFVEAVESIRKDRPFIFKFVKDESEAKDASAVVRIVDDAGKPPMTVSPEVGRGELNVAVLVDDIKTDAGKNKFRTPRARKGLLRTISFTLGAGGTQFPGNIIAAVKVRELDYCGEFIPADTLATFAQNAKKFDLKPEYIVPYEVACEEGWAPQPKTEEQKKIWNDVHAMPENPIQIKFDPKTDKK